MHSIRNLWLEMKGVLRLARQTIHAQLEPLDLSGAEGDLLFILLTGSDGLRQEQLADQLDIGKAAVSRVVGSLEAKGYVVRTRPDDDKRALCVSLTRRAHTIRSDIIGIYDRLYGRVSQGIPVDAFRAVETLLTQVAANLETAAGER